MHFKDKHGNLMAVKTLNIISKPIQMYFDLRKGSASKIE